MSLRFVGWKLLFCPSDMTRKSVLLVGATGATGNAILQELIACKQFV